MQVKLSLDKIKSNREAIEKFLRDSSTGKILNFAREKNSNIKQYDMVLMDSNPIPAGEYFKDIGEKTDKGYKHEWELRKYAYVFSPANLTFYAAKVRNQIPILINHNTYSDSVTVGFAKDFESDPDTLKATGEILTHDNEGNALVGNYYSLMLDSFGLFPLSISLDIKDTSYWQDDTESGNINMVEQEGTEDKPDLAYVKEAEVLEVSFVYQGRVASAQATPKTSLSLSHDMKRIESKVDDLAQLIKSQPNQITNKQEVA